MGIRRPAYWGGEVDACINGYTLANGAWLRDADGTWHQQLRHEGRIWFDVDSSPGEASRWLTFHALRVLTWWDGDALSHRAASQEDTHRTPRYTIGLRDIGDHPVRG